MHLSFFTNTRKDLISHARGPCPAHIEPDKWQMLRENLLHGDSLQKIGDRRGISRERVRQILEEVNQDYWQPPFPGLDKRTSNLLRLAGYTDPRELFSVSNKELLEVFGLGESTLRQIRKQYPYREAKNAG